MLILKGTRNRLRKNDGMIGGRKKKGRGRERWECRIRNREKADGEEVRKGKQ